MSETSVAPDLPPRSRRDWLASDKPMARIVRNMLWLMSGKGLGAVLSLIYLGIATRTLGVVQFGHFALILSMGSAIVLFAQFDCWRVVMRFGAAHLEAGRADALGRLVAACRIFDLAGALIGSAIAWAVSASLVYFGQWEAETGRTAFFYCLALLAAVRSTPNGVLRLHHRFDLSTYAETMVPISRIVGTLAVLFIRPDVTGFLIAWAVSELTAAAVFWLFAWRVDAPALAWQHSLNLRKTLRDEKGLLSFLVVSNLGISLTGFTMQAPVLMLGGFVGPAAAGLFRLAFQLSRAVAKVVTLLARTTFAELNHVRAKGGDQALRNLLRKADRVALVGGLGLMLVVILLGKPILWAVAGSEFLPAYPVLLVLGIGVAADLIAINKEPALLAATSGVSALRLRLVGTAIQLALLAILLPMWQEIGAAWAIAGASIVTNALFMLAVRRHIGAKQPE